MTRLFFALCALFAAMNVAADDAPTRLLRYPDLHGDRLLFHYAGDLWSVPVSGGDAYRLTAHDGYEYLPRISPDGRWIAFSAEYEGNMDVYVMPATGGEPARLTWHPLADRVVTWTPDGKVVFRSKRSSVVQSYDRLFTIAPTGGVPQELPLPSAGMSSFSADGTKIAFNAIANETQYWKRYRGGTQSHIGIYDLVSKQYDEVPHADAAELFPMWFGNAIFFVSDRDGVMNLYRFDIASRAIVQLTRHTEYDVKWPSLALDGSGRIVYTSGGTLYVYDIAKGASAPVSIRVRSDAPSTRVTTINVEKWLQTIALSPSGVRALIGARGEVFTVPAKEGEIRDITNTSGARELWPAWSPDGKWIAYASDRSGEYELYVRPQDGSGEERRLTSLGPGFRSALTWSPDSKKIAFSELSLALSYVVVASGKVTVIDRSDYGPIDDFSWSPDSRWLVYAKVIATRFGQLFARALDSTEPIALTDGRSDDSNPRFDDNGRYVWFLSKRTFTPRFSDFEQTFNFNATTGIFALPLRRDIASPFAPKSDEENAPRPVATDKPVTVSIDADVIRNRVVPVSVDAGDYAQLRFAKNRLFYLAGTGDTKTLRAYDIAERSDRSVIEKISAYALSANGEKLIYRAGTSAGILDANATGKTGDGALHFDNLTMRLDRRAEWKQIFDEAWRMMRDNFYDPTMRGVDWPAMKRRYEAELPYAALRSDVNFLIGEMNAELGVSHISASGGDTLDTHHTAAGLLGADFDVANGLYRIRHIYRGDNTLPDARAPLAEPAIDVREGDYILAVNGRPLRAPESLFAAFEETAGKQVTLQVNDRPQQDGARTFVVVPVASDATLRYLDWIATNRRKVEDATQGRCAYVHLPNTSESGISAFGRQFYAQSDHDCLLLDARWNTGGFIPDFYFERLARRHLEHDAPRYGADEHYQRPAILGPKVLVINEYAGSGGDSVADYFRKFALGPIVGKRTWGGLMGIGGELPMIDKGRVTVPNISAWDVVNGKSTWIVENRGVEPDIDVDNRPDLVIQGRDPQLERGIAILMEELAKHPPETPKRPPYGAQ
ncbi:MAG TPA: PDZ domain-containing protein [Thermoanaerobaculia bacterium]|nr:PDZ domain-containing protein [Thermoanaerobaculia bacterium]